MKIYLAGEDCIKVVIFYGERGGILLEEEDEGWSVFCGKDVKVSFLQS